MTKTEIAALDCDVLILGIGNLLWADEAFGVRTLAELDRRHIFPETVRLLDGGTQGLFLLPHIMAAERLLVIDAVDMGLRPGQLAILRNDEVPRALGARKFSLHQTTFEEVLALAALSDRFPQNLALVGVQAATIEDFGGSMSAPVIAAIEPAIAAIRAELAGWGIVVDESAGAWEPRRDGSDKVRAELRSSDTLG